MSEAGTQRGGGRLAGALARKSGAGRAAGDESPAARESQGFEAPGRPMRRRKRAKVGRRSNKAKYKQSLAYVRKDVRERVEQARKNPKVRAALEAELRDRGVEHKSDAPEYSALVELLLVDWLDSVGWGAGE